jgi:hypothetical protein
MFALADTFHKHGFADQPQVKSCMVAADLPVKRRIAIGEFDREAELVCVEIAGTREIRNEELRLNRIENGTWRRLYGFIGHGICS